MNCILTRYPDHAGPQGIFGVLTDEGDKILAYTLEHAYLQPDGSWAPKVAVGSYTCVQHPPNRLPYNTYLVQDVPQFMGQPVLGILIHCGNFDRDSEGCILLGSSDAPDYSMVCGSRVAFAQFMDLQAGASSFILVIK